MTQPPATPAPLLLPTPDASAVSTSSIPSTVSTQSPALRPQQSAPPAPRARALFAFCTQIVICALLSLMIWIGEACTTRDPDLRRFRLLKRYFNLALKVFRTVRDKPERLTPAQLAWLRRAAETIQHLFGRPLDFSPLDALAQPATAKPMTPHGPDRPDPKRPNPRRSASSDYCPPVPDELDAKYVKAPGQVLATVCANLVRLMGDKLPVQAVRERLGQELELAQKEPSPHHVSVLGGAAFTRSVFAFIPSASPVPPSPAPHHHPPP